MPDWLTYLLLSTAGGYIIAAGGYCAVKAGRNPILVLFLLIPIANILVIWAFAYARWPFALPKTAAAGAVEPPPPQV